MPRLFFALWPDTSTSLKLAEVGRESDLDGRRLLPARKLHITIEFPGMVDPACCQELITAAGKVVARRFSLLINTSGWWKRARIAWLAPNPVPAGLSELHQAIHALVLAAGVPVQDRPYSPHITLARNINMPVKLEFEPIYWEVSDFCLVESNTRPQGAEYQIIRRWPLT
ncbi:MAG: RNA 2',3'-cyclic phosphodiesterase [Gammaproteobacteria bacterium]